ncbi:MAG: methylmalonyl-CoA mutase family protein [Polyangiaceae bacterium]
MARLAAERFPSAVTALVCTARYHDAGADAVDELAIAIATGARYLRALVDAGLDVDAAAARVAVRMAVGRDTFLELCKLRALRVCWSKLLLACGAATHRLEVHAVCSSRTLAARDPWVNMLRVTTQVFAAVLGGADLVTPRAFDEALATRSPLGQRVARNTALVLREESGLGRVADPGGGSYYLESVTDALARAAWARMREIEAEGGMVAALASRKVQQRIEASWQAQLRRIVTRRQAVLGVSEFANLDEVLPAPPLGAAPGGGAGLSAHRDAEAFEALRARADPRQPPPEALLSTLGPFAESRPRAGFAAGFFAAGGIRTRESGEPEGAAIACVCGSDERYAAEAVERVRALKAAGCGRVLLAGKPGEQERALREAGVDGFVFVGCDVVGVLGELLEVAS